MSKNDKKYFYKTLAMSNDITRGEKPKAVVTPSPVGEGRKGVSLQRANER